MISLEPCSSNGMGGVTALCKELAYKGILQLSGCVIEFPIPKTNCLEPCCEPWCLPAVLPWGPA